MTSSSRKSNAHAAPPAGDATVLGGRLRDVWHGFASIRFLLADVRSIWRKDPALRGEPLRALEVPLYASFWALLVHRLAHPLQCLGVPFVPRLLSQIARFLTGIEIHPGAVIGSGLFIDHGMGVVIGETAVVGRDVLLFHGVTLGGVDDRPGRRHPIVGDRAVIGAGAKVLGAITIGSDARIGAQAVVLSDIPEGATAVGIPARVLRASAVHSGGKTSRSTPPAQRRRPRGNHRHLPPETMAQVHEEHVGRRGQAQRTEAARQRPA